VRRIGLDLALRAPHRAAIFDDGDAVGGSFAVARSRTGVDELIRRATTNHDGPCEFIMEPTGYAWVPLAAELVRLGHRTYVPKPQKTHALRKFLREHTKTDATDAKAAALLRHVDPTGVHELKVPTAEQLGLQMFVKQRARLVADASKSKQRIHAVLLLAHPLLSETLGASLFTAVGRALLRKHLDPSRVLERGRSQLRRVWSQKVRGSVDDEQFDQVWSAYEAAAALYAELRREQRLPFDYEHVQHVANQELDTIEFIEQQVVELERKIRHLYRTVDPDQTLLQVPGVGNVIGAALQALIGDINRFPNVKSFAAYTGLVPRTNLTAGEGKPGQRMTKAGADIIKQYLFLAAETARLRDPELAATYAAATARGKHHNSAIGIVAHKLARRIYAVLKQRASRPAARSPYRLRQPDNGTELSEKQALEYVRTNYPSKSERARREKAARDFPKTGSPEGATKGSCAAPPTPSVATLSSCGNPREQPVVSP
jgi:transposase